MQFNVQIKVTNRDGLSHVQNVRVDATSANHAKGAAQYQVQMASPGMQTQAVDCWKVEDESQYPAAEVAALYNRKAG